MALDPILLEAGDLRHAISIAAKNTANVTAFGSPVTTLNTVWTCKAKITSTTSLSYREMVAAQSISSSMTHLIVIRYPGDSIVIEPGMMVVHGTTNYVIQAVDNVLQRNRVLNLLCKSVDQSSTDGGAA